MTFTPALSGVALAEKAAGSSKRRGRQCDHPPLQNPPCLLTACSTSWALLALSLKLFPRLAPWLPFLNAGFYGKRLLTHFFVTIVGLWTTFFLASSQAPAREGWHADAMFQIDSVPKIFQLTAETETSDVRRLMQGKTKRFHKHVNFFVWDTFLLPPLKSEGWERASSCYHSGEVDSKEVLTLKNIRWTAASESEPDHRNSRKQLCSGHCEIIFFWANYMLAVKMTQLLSLFFFSEEFYLRIRRHLHHFCPTCYIKEHLHHQQIFLLCWYCIQIQTQRYRAFYFSLWTLKSSGLFLISCSLKKVT